jgi:hypothetical protein
MSSYAMPQRRPRKQFDALAARVAANDSAPDASPPEAIPPVPAAHDLSRSHRPLDPLPLFRPDGHAPAGERSGTTGDAIPRIMRNVAQARMPVKEVGFGAARTATNTPALPHSSRAVTGGDVVQMVRQTLEPVVGEFTRAALLAHITTIYAQIAEIEDDEKTLGFIDMKAIAELRGVCDTKMQALQQRLQQDGHDDAFAMARPDILNPGTPLAQSFYDVIAAARAIRFMLNDSFKGYRAYVAKQEEQAALMAEEEAAKREISSFNQQKKVAKKIAREDEAHDDASEEAAAKVVNFPHKGKHCPPPKAVNDAKLLEGATAGKGKVALYITNDVGTVVGWEAEATANGLRLHDNFTVVHKFKKLIGADQGAMTYFIRIDGGDHGHPIIESGSPTSFDTYVRTEIEHYRAKNDAAKLREIAEYLTGVGLDPRTYKLLPTG